MTFTLVYSNNCEILWSRKKWRRLTVSWPEQLSTLPGRVALWQNIDQPEAHFLQCGSEVTFFLVRTNQWSVQGYEVSKTLGRFLSKAQGTRKCLRSYDPVEKKAGLFSSHLLLFPKVSFSYFVVNLFPHAGWTHFKGFSHGEREQSLKWE